LASNESRAGRNSWDSEEGEEPNPTCLGRLRDALVGGEVPIEGLAEDMNSVRALIRSGEARLEVVEWPWGLEFFLVGAETPPTASLEAAPTPISRGK
jgi:hypothetical protein